MTPAERADLVAWRRRGWALGLPMADLVRPPRQLRTGIGHEELRSGGGDPTARLRPMQSDRPPADSGRFGALANPPWTPVRTGIIQGRRRDDVQEPAARPATPPTIAPPMESPSVARAREQRRRIAWHEAAHCLVAYLVGAELVSVDLDDAATVYRAGSADPVGQLAATLAGLAADWLAGHGSAEEALDGAIVDRGNAARAADRLDPRNPAGMMARAQALAGRLLNRHWVPLERLTAALDVHGRVDGADLEAEIEAALAGVDVVEWVATRRATVDAAGTDPAAWEAAWATVSRRWHGAARAETRELYDTTWQAAEERRFDEMLTQRAAIESGRAPRVKEGRAEP